MIKKNHVTKRYGKTVALDQPVALAQGRRAFTGARIAGLLVTVVLLSGLTYLGASSSSATISVPQRAHAGQLTMHPCTYPTEKGVYRADCGTLVVPEDRANPRSRLIALPVVRVLARSSHPLAPVFRLNGGPGVTNMTFPDASRLAAQHDVVMVGYRGVDGSSVLNCPEVTAALEKSADFLAKASLSAYSKAFASCGQRLEREGVDLAGYTLSEQADDIEAARVALGYQRIDLVSESEGTRLAMIYSWRYPNSVDRSAMIGVNPPGTSSTAVPRPIRGSRLTQRCAPSSLPAAPAPPTSPPACSTRRQTCRSGGTSCPSSGATSWSGRSSGSPTRPRKEVTQHCPGR